MLGWKLHIFGTLFHEYKYYDWDFSESIHGKEIKTMIVKTRILMWSFSDLEINDTSTKLLGSLNSTGHWIKLSEFATMRIFAVLLRKLVFSRPMTLLVMVIRWKSSFIAALWTCFKRIKHLMTNTLFYFSTFFSLFIVNISICALWLIPVLQKKNPSAI